MDIFGNLDSFLGSNPAIAQLANSAVSGLVQKPAPKVKEVVPAIQTITTPSAQGMSTGMMIGIGVAVAGVAVLMMMIFKRK